MRRVLFGLLGMILLSSHAYGLGNIHLKNTISKNNYLKETLVGNRYVNTYEYDIGQRLILFTDLASPYSIWERDSREQIHMNIELNSAPIEFHSWILLQAMVAYELEKKVGSVSFLAEWDLIIWTESMRYLEQAIFEVTPEVDYSNHSRFDFARRHELYMVDSYRAWQQGDAAFETMLAARKSRLGGKWLTVEEFLKMDPTDRLKRKALKLKKFWDDIR